MTYYNIIKIFFNPKVIWNVFQNVNGGQILIIWFIPLSRHQAFIEAMKIRKWCKILAFLKTIFLQKCKIGKCAYWNSKLQTWVFIIVRWQMWKKKKKTKPQCFKRCFGFLGFLWETEDTHVYCLCARKMDIYRTDPTAVARKTFTGVYKVYI